MPGFEQWWQDLPRSQKRVWTMACCALIFAGGIDIGRSLFQLTH